MSDDSHEEKRLVKDPTVNVAKSETTNGSEG